MHPQCASVFAVLDKLLVEILNTIGRVSPKLIEIKLHLAAKSGFPHKHVKHDPEFHRTSGPTAAHETFIPTGVEVALHTDVGLAHYLFAAVVVTANELHEDILVRRKAIENPDQRRLYNGDVQLPLICHSK